MTLDIEELRREASAFNLQLEARKREWGPDFPWYPYGTLINFEHLHRLLTGENRQLFARFGKGSRIADIGAADGDLAFFLESRGYRVDVIDHAPTNFNGMRGVRLLKKKLRSSVGIHDLDLDDRFELPRGTYDLVVFLGILYHLKNPYFMLESLARTSRWCVVSTRIARFAGEPRVEIGPLPAAYLLDPAECNNDSTNFWIFTEAGLRRIFARTGWDIADYVSVGNTTASDPATPEGDERAFALLRSRLVS